MASESKETENAQKSNAKLFATAVDDFGKILRGEVLDPPQYGWYSQEYVDFGHFTTQWETPEGKIVTVTEVTDDFEPASRWSDLKFVGRLCKFVGTKDAKEKAIQKLAAAASPFFVIPNTLAEWRETVKAAPSQPLAKVVVHSLEKDLFGAQLRVNTCDPFWVSMTSDPRNICGRSSGDVSRWHWIEIHNPFLYTIASKTMSSTMNTTSAAEKLILSTPEMPAVADMSCSSSDNKKNPTITTSNSAYDDLWTKKDINGNLLFKVITVDFQCDLCRRDKLVGCVHLRYLPPEWPPWCSRCKTTDASCSCRIVKPSTLRISHKTSTQEESATATETETSKPVNQKTAQK